jgi:hypothetical protein
MAEVVDCCMKVPIALGPGFAEAIYHRALLVELGERGITHYAQVRSYMRAVGVSLGLLVNFANAKLGPRRVEPRVGRHR